MPNETSRRGRGAGAGHERARRIVAGLALAIAGAAPSTGASVFFDGFEFGTPCAWSTSAGATPCCGALLFEESWSVPDGSPWPAPWAPAGNEVALADVQNGRGRLRPAASDYSLARMVAPGAARDVQALFTVIFEDVATQGASLSVRQNGGYLTQTTPPGQGYTVFVAANPDDGPGLDLWIESGGVEDQLADEPVAPFASGVPYRVRYLARTVNPTLVGELTDLKAKLWPSGTAEPEDWTVDTTDDSGPLLDALGGFSIDSWSTLTAAPLTAHTLVDDLQVFAVCTD